MILAILVYRRTVSAIYDYEMVMAQYGRVDLLAAISLMVVILVSSNLSIKIMMIILSQMLAKLLDTGILF